MPFALKFLLKEFVRNVIEELCLCRNGGGGGGGGGLRHHYHSNKEFIFMSKFFCQDTKSHWCMLGQIVYAMFHWSYKLDAA